MDVLYGCNVWMYCMDVMYGCNVWMLCFLAHSSVHLYFGKNVHSKAIYRRPRRSQRFYKHGRRGEEI